MIRRMTSASFALFVAFVALTALLVACAAKEPARGPAMIVYESYNDAVNDIYIMNEDGTEPRALVSDASWDGTVAPSPDGKRLAFASDRDGDMELYVMNMDGSGLVQLTYNEATDFLPAWSPDGQRIAFASDRLYNVELSGGSLEIESGMELYVMNADGTEVERLTGGPDDVSLYPAWSPDGKKLAFMTISTVSAIYVLDMSPAIGEAIALMPESTVNSWSPRWSPDGKYLAFMGDDGENRDIYRADADGKNVKNLTANWAPLSGDPTWSPDGQHILFGADAEGLINLYTMTLDGENIKLLAQGGGDRSLARATWFR